MKFSRVINLQYNFIEVAVEVVSILKFQKSSKIYQLIGYFINLHNLWE